MKKIDKKLLFDLKWVICSPTIYNSVIGVYPNIKKNTTSLNFKLCADSLKRVNFSTQELEEFIHQKNTRLIGKYFEALFEFSLMISPDIELLFSNKQISDSKNNTVGEIDFLYRNIKSGNLHHLELAGKFYLAFRNLPDWKNFIGPNPNDNLERKINHLLTKQVPLLHTEAGLKFLSTHNLNESITSEYLIKGYLFYHFPLFQKKQFISPPGINPDHLKGWWIYFNEFDLLEETDKSYCILERNEWMRTMPKSHADLMSFREVKEKVLLYFQHNNYPLLISRMREDVGYYKETDRGFIVSKFWPNTEQL